MLLCAGAEAGTLRPLHWCEVLQARHVGRFGWGSVDRDVACDWFSCTSWWEMRPHSGKNAWSASASSSKDFPLD